MAKGPARRCARDFLNLRARLRRDTPDLLLGQHQQDTLPSCSPRRSGLSDRGVFWSRIPDRSRIGGSVVALPTPGGTKSSAHTLDQSNQLAPNLGRQRCGRAGHRPAPGPLRTVAQAQRLGVSTLLLQVPEPAPEIWWPETVVANGSPIEAFEVVSRGSDPVQNVTTSGSAVPQGAGTTRLVEVSSDRLVIDVESEGGTVAIRRAYPSTLASTE